jgi:hypothetical protein
VRHQLERGCPWCLTLTTGTAISECASGLILECLEIVRAPEGESWLGLQGPSGRAETLPDPHGYPETYNKGASLTVLLRQHVREICIEIGG